jgi:protease stability complex PrcB-like protein
VINLLALLIGIAGGPPAPDLRTLAHGPQSGITAPRQVVVTSEADWEKLWAEHAAGRGRPAVDFNREIVAAIFMGGRPTAGYDIDVTAVRRDGDGTIVEYRERTPPPDAITAQVLTSPFVIVALPKPDGPVRFERASP